MLLNAKQACGYLGIGRYLFDTAVDKGLIPFIRPSKRRLFNTEDLDRWQKNTQNLIDYTKTEAFGMPISISFGQTDKPITIGELLAQEKERLRKEKLLKKSTNATKTIQHLQQA
jgi:excisionase family DNA binding protein